MPTNIFAEKTDLSIAIIGSGVVGTATGTGLLGKGHRVVFCDVAASRRAELRASGLETVEPGALGEHDFDAYLISVPSPTVGGVVDTSIVAAASAAVGRAIGKHAGWPLIVVRSTVPPGTTEGLVCAAVEGESGRRAGDEFGLCMNPEFLREISASEDFVQPRVIVVGALDRRSDHALRGLYARWPDVPVVSMSLRSAEMTKYTANLFNAAKISFFNEMEGICLRLGIDPRPVFAAAAYGAEGLWNPEYGTRGLAPFGGACLPKDSAGFLGFASERGLADEMLMLQATIETNARVAQTADELGSPDEPLRVQAL